MLPTVCSKVVVNVCTFIALANLWFSLQGHNLFLRNDYTFRITLEKKIEK